MSVTLCVIFLPVKDLINHTIKFNQSESILFDVSVKTIIEEYLEVIY